MSDRPDPPAPKPRRAALARWAAILLPIVLGLRALLLIFQLNTEHRANPGVPPAWPPSPGEELIFRADDRAIRDWSATATRKAFPARILTKNLAAAEKDTGCLLNPAAMAEGGGTLRLLEHAGADGWRVRWRGASTVPAPATEPAASGHAADMDRLEAAMLSAADCGTIAELEVSETTLHDLVNILAGRPLVRGDSGAPEQELKMRVQGPAD